MGDSFNCRLLLLIACLCCLSASKSIYFGRVIKCLDVNVTSCSKWNTTIQLSLFQNYYSYMCFPENAHVLSDKGPKPMNELEIGDRILGYDFENNQQEYAEVSAWLHRDTETLAEFTQVVSNNSWTFTASAGHNIAYNKNGTIGFKYADQLAEGDELITLSMGNDDLTVSRL